MIYPASYPMTIEQRASFDRTFTMYDAEGDALDLTDFTLTAKLWTERRRELAEFTLTWVDQTIGQFTLTLTPEETTPLSGAGVWDLLVEDPDGNKDYWIRGAVLIEPGYTT